MIAAADFLSHFGNFVLVAGADLAIVLFIVAIFRDPARSELFAWSISTQWVAGLRILRRAAGFGWWSRLALGAMAIGVTCRLLSGLLALGHLYPDVPKG